MAIEVSDVVLGPPFEMPNDDLKDAILGRSQPGTVGRVSLLLPQLSTAPRLSEPPSVCNRPSEENALALTFHLEVSPASYEPVDTV